MYKEVDACVSSLQLQVGTEISVLDMGVKFSYQIPSFSVLAVDFRQVKLQISTEDGSVVLSDGFIRADPLLEVKPMPFLVKIKEFCLVPVEEFSNDANVESLSPMINDRFLILWQ